MKKIRRIIFFLVLSLGCAGLALGQEQPAPPPHPSATPPPPPGYDGAQGFGGYPGSAHTYVDPQSGDIVTSVIAPVQPVAPNPPIYVAPQVNPTWPGGGGYTPQGPQSHYAPYGPHWSGPPHHPPHNPGPPHKPGPPPHQPPHNPGPPHEPGPHSHYAPHGSHGPGQAALPHHSPRHEPARQYGVQQYGPQYDPHRGQPQRHPYRQQYAPPPPPHPGIHGGNHRHGGRHWNSHRGAPGHPGARRPHSVISRPAGAPPVA